MSEMKIDKAIYEGYVWWSDENAPCVIDNEEFELQIADEANPFVVEAQLYCAETETSIAVKYVDGSYRNIRIENKELAGKISSDEKKYHATRMNGKVLRFRQYWREESDPLCEGMAVLQPAELAFVGFEKV